MQADFEQEEEDADFSEKLDASELLKSIETMEAKQAEVPEDDPDDKFPQDWGLSDLPEQRSAELCTGDDDDEAQKDRKNRRGVARALGSCRRRVGRSRPNLSCG